MSSKWLGEFKLHFYNKDIDELTLLIDDFDENELEDIDEKIEAYELIKNTHELLKLEKEKLKIEFEKTKRIQHYI